MCILKYPLQSLEERYIASTAYTANEPDEIGFQKGVVVDILQKNIDGWWLIRCSKETNFINTLHIPYCYPEITPNIHPNPRDEHP